MTRTTKAKSTMTDTAQEEAKNGIPEIEIDGQTYKVEFNYRTYSEALAELGAEPNLMDPAILSKYAAFAMKRHHPMVTADQIMDASPPALPLARAARTAQVRLFWGDNPPSTTNAQAE